MNQKKEPRTLKLVRTALLGIFLIAAAGTLVELLLLEHFDSAAQLIPLGTIGLSLLVLIWYGISRSAVSLRVFRAAMVIFVLTGTLGLFLHYNGNRLFELSVVPEMSGFELFWKAITGATPALAPGSLIQIGLVGLLFTYRHPLLNGNPQTSTQQLETQ